MGALLMDMLKGKRIAEADLTDWRKLAQGLHARYLVDDFGTGARRAQGRGSPSDEIRDATGRVPNLWFGGADEHETPRQRFHIEVVLVA
jgi:hypothetical protein